MDNEETKEKEEKPTADDTGKGDKSSKTPLIDIANQAAERMEKANEVRAELLEKEEELAAKKLLGGETDAGIQPEKPKEETPEEYVDKVMSGVLNKKDD